MSKFKMEVNKKKGSYVKLNIDFGDSSEIDGLVAEIPAQLDYIALECAVSVAEDLMEEEVNELCGERYHRDPARAATRYGSQGGSIAIAGRKVRVKKPRVRFADGGGEVELESYEKLKRGDAMNASVLESLIRGVSSRDYAGVVTASCAGFGMTKSSVSRRFVEASAEKLRELCERRFDGLRFVVIFIDGVVYAGATMLAALGVTSEGWKKVLGLRQGATENAEVCKSLLADIADRGVDTGQPTLFVLDGSKALKAAVERLFGRHAVIQRCRYHKKENVRAHVAKYSLDELNKKMNDAYCEGNYRKALSKLQSTASWLEKINPDAAASLREGMEETLTITKLGIPPQLRATLATTNPIESAFSVVRRLTRRVSNWRNGGMRHRWCATGLLIAESKFKRIRGYRNIPMLIRALKVLTGDGPFDKTKGAA